MTFLSRLRRAVRNSPNPRLFSCKLALYTGSTLVFSLVPFLLIHSGGRLRTGLINLAFLLTVYALIVLIEVVLVMAQQDERDNEATESTTPQ